MADRSLPRPAIVLGLAGLAPQALCLMLASEGGADRWFALAAGCIYAAIILSFLGGLWWMAGLLGGLRQSWLYGLAVMPSLIGWGAMLPWCVGWRWPGPSLVVLGMALIASPLVDLFLGRHVTLPVGWFKLRCQMAWGLGVMTLLLSVA